MPKTAWCALLVAPALLIFTSPSLCETPTALTNGQPLPVTDPTRDSTHRQQSREQEDAQINKISSSTWQVVLEARADAGQLQMSMTHSPRNNNHAAAGDKDSQINEVDATTARDTLVAAAAGDGNSDCPGSCYCDAAGTYVSCIGEKAWDSISLASIPTTVVRLELRNFRLGMLRSMHLKRFQSVAELRLQQTAIYAVDYAAFKTMTKLQRLDLSENAVSCRTHTDRLV